MLKLIIGILSLIISFAMQRPGAPLLLALALLVARVSSHGTLNLPESRNGAQAGLGLGQGGRTQPYSVAYWFSDLTRVPAGSNATMADDDCAMLTTCPRCGGNGTAGSRGAHCAGSRLDRMPWRAPTCGGRKSRSNAISR